MRRETVVRNHIVFIGTDNRINNELFQLLNWRFEVTYYNSIEEISLSELNTLKPEIVIVSMVGNIFDCYTLFEYIQENCSDISVITISSKDESTVYNSFYETAQFHRILRPVTGRKILSICKAVISGKSYSEVEELSIDNTNETPHILVVDDNAMILRNIKNILDSKYSVAVAPSGMHAFISIGKKMPDLILLDYEMPDMNGKEVMKKLQSDEELREIPIVFLTSADSKEVVMELLALKPAGYILKPADSQMLLDRIVELVGK